MRLATSHVRPRRSGVALIIVLVVVVLLALAAFQFAELMLQEFAAAQSALRAAQAKAAAESGVYYAAAMLSDQDSFSGSLSGNVHDNEGMFHAIDVSGGTTRRTARFSIVSAVDSSETSVSRSYRFGAQDESGKININALMRLDSSGEIAHDMLMKLPNMTEEVADAIIDWIDSNDEPRPTGAENQTYSGMMPSYRCKNGPLDSLEELLLVRGVTPELLFGNDRNRNGVEDPGEDDGSGWNPGWAAYLTIYSRERNVDSEGNARTYLNDTTLSNIYDPLKEALGQPLADFIILFRTQSTSAPMGDQQVVDASEQDASAKVQEVLNQTNARPRSIASRYELINGTVYFEVGEGDQRRMMRWRSPLQDDAQLRELLPKLLDKTTTQRNAEIPARINVRTAPPEVLACLPGITEADVQAIIDRRPQLGSADPGDPVYQTPAWMLTEANISVDKMRALERYVTSSSQVYRVQSIGYFDEGGPVARIEAVIDTNNGRPRILMWRDLSDLGRGFNVMSNSP